VVLRGTFDGQGPSNRRHLVNSNISSRNTGTNYDTDYSGVPMLKCVLEEFLQIEGVTTAALIATDGFLIECAGTEPADNDALAALGSCAMNFFSRAGIALDRGPARQFVLEHESGSIIFMQISDDELLAVITTTNSTPGRLAYILPKISTRVVSVI
jgi:predicted regulator of Ras-like GTPase activity (Roadblock/LC7/MglB family)